MAITMLSDSGLAGNKYYDLAAGNTYMEPIATTLVGAGGVSSIDFTNIPQTYTHLEIRGIARSNYSSSTGGDYAKVRFNGDTGSNYSLHYLQGDGASVAAGATANSSWINILRFAVNAADGQSNAFGVSVSSILDYTNQNKYKTFRSLSGMDVNSNNTQGTVVFQSGLWMNTSPITSISLTLGNGTLITQYSRVSLYGLKG